MYGNAAGKGQLYFSPEHLGIPQDWNPDAAYRTLGSVGIARVFELPKSVTPLGDTEIGVMV